MIIPPYIKRRISEIDTFLTQYLIRHPSPIVVAQHKEEYLHTISCGMTGWFIQTYDYCSELHTDYHKKVNDIIPVIKYLIRTKVTLHWEKMNGVKHPELS
jgi:hypothetical protein